MAARRPVPAAETPKPARDKLTVLLDAETIEHIRNAAWQLRRTISELAGPALERELARLQREHNHGKPFPRRAGPVKTGRPLKAPR